MDWIGLDWTRSDWTWNPVTPSPILTQSTTRAGERARSHPALVRALGKLTCLHREAVHREVATLQGKTKALTDVQRAPRALRFRESPRGTGVPRDSEGYRGASRHLGPSHRCCSSFPCKTKSLWSSAPRGGGGTFSCVQVNVRIVLPEFWTSDVSSWIMPHT